MEKPNKISSVVPLQTSQIEISNEIFRGVYAAVYKGIVCSVVFRQDKSNNIKVDKAYDLSYSKRGLVLIGEDGSEVVLRTTGDWNDEPIEFITTLSEEALLEMAKDFTASEVEELQTLQEQICTLAQDDTERFSFRRGDVVESLECSCYKYPILGRPAVFLEYIKTIPATVVRVDDIGVAIQHYAPDCSVLIKNSAGTSDIVVVYSGFLKLTHRESKK